MFGITAFAQSPFATLGVTGETFAVNVDDSFTTTDAYASFAAFNPINDESFDIL